ASHPLIAPLPAFRIVSTGKASEFARGEWMFVECEPPIYHRGAAVREPLVTVWPNLRRRADPSHWAYVFARLWLHIALNHLDPAKQDLASMLTAWVVAERMIAHAGVGRRPDEFPPLPAGLPRSESGLVRYFSEQKAPPEVDALSLSRCGEPFWS